MQHSLLRDRNNSAEGAVHDILDLLREMHPGMRLLLLILLRSRSRSHLRLGGALAEGPVSCRAKMKLLLLLLLCSRSSSTTNSSGILICRWTRFRFGTLPRGMTRTPRWIGHSSPKWRFLQPLRPLQPLQPLQLLLRLLRLLLQLFLLLAGRGPEILTSLKGSHRGEIPIG